MMRKMGRGAGLRVLVTVVVVGVLSRDDEVGEKGIYSASVWSF